MGFKISKFATNSQKETEGVWCDVGGGLEIKVGRMGNVNYEAYLRKIGKPVAKLLRSGQIEDSVLEELSHKAVAKHILLGWKNLTDDNDKPIPYSEQKALELITQYRDFYRIVIEQSTDVELFRDAEVKDTEGNSSAA